MFTKRPQIENFDPYIPGRPIDEVKKEYGLKKVIKLASNENPLGPSAEVKRIIKSGFQEINRYPEGSSMLLRRAIARYYGVSPKEVIVGAGADEIIELIGKAYFCKDDNMVSSEHAFIRYKMAGDLMGIQVQEVPMIDMTHDLKGMASRVNRNTKAVFVANPNNPTGTYNNTVQVESLLNSVPKNVMVIFDEAYYEYAKDAYGYPEMLGFFGKYPNVVIMRTFSKIYGLAGMRVGYALAPEEIVSVLDRIRPPFNITLMSQELALKALGDKKQIARSLKTVNEGKEYLYGELDKLNVRYVRSAANFVLVDVNPKAGKEVFIALLKKGVIVRAMDEYRFPGYIRVSIGLMQEMRFFLKAFKEVMNIK